MPTLTVPAARFIEKPDEVVIAGKAKLQEDTILVVLARIQLAPPLLLSYRLSMSSKIPKDATQDEEKEKRFHTTFPSFCHAPKVAQANI